MKNARVVFVMIGCAVLIHGTSYAASSDPAAQTRLVREFRRCGKWSFARGAGGSGSRETRGGRKAL